jgi:hypothetical protein
MVAFTVSAVGLNAALPVFWTLAPAFLTGPSAAVGIAFINSVAAAGGVPGTLHAGIGEGCDGEFTGGLYLLGGGVIVGVLFVLAFAHAHDLEQAPEGQVAL